MMGPYGAGQPGDDQWIGLVILVMTDDRIGAVNSMMTDDARFGHTSTVTSAGRQLTCNGRREGITYVLLPV